jgi:hypothetical protein
MVNEGCGELVSTSTTVKPVIAVEEQKEELAPNYIIPSPALPGTNRLRSPPIAWVRGVETEADPTGCRGSSAPLCPEDPGPPRPSQETAPSFTVSPGRVQACPSHPKGGQDCPDHVGRRGLAVGLPVVALWPLSWSTSAGSRRGSPTSTF